MAEQTSKWLVKPDEWRDGWRRKKRPEVEDSGRQQDETRRQTERKKLRANKNTGNSRGEGR